MNKVITFIFLTFSYSIVGYYGVIHSGFLGFSPAEAMFFLMWCPTLAAVTCSLIFRQKLSSLGLKIPKLKWIATAYLLPLAYGFLTYGVVWLLGITKLDGGQSAQLYRLAWYGILINLAFVTGEEIGWRGYLMPQLKKLFGSNIASVICGIIWSVWHWPIIFAGLYLVKIPLLPQLLLLTVSLIGFSLMAEWLRLVSGSIIPVIMLHGSHNNFIQGYFDSVTIVTSKTANYLTGEAGIAMTLVFVLLGVLFWRLIRSFQPRGISSAIPTESSSGVFNR
jgi:membrane protease YdiL (CAAX protease family)